MKWLFGFISKKGMRPTRIPFQFPFSHGISRGIDVGFGGRSAARP